MPAPQKPEDVFRCHPPWMNLPTSFLAMLADRFDSAQQATDFAEFFEDKGFLNNDFYHIVSSNGDCPNFALGCIASALFFHAGTLMKSQDLPEAKRVLEAAIRIQPRHPVAWARLAIVTHVLGDQDAAEYWADKALTFEPDLESNDSWEIGLRSWASPDLRKEASQDLGEDVEGDWNGVMRALQMVKAAGAEGRHTGLSDESGVTSGTDECGYRTTFLYRNGLNIVYSVFIVALVLNGIVAVFCFKAGRIVLGLCSLLAIMMLPKAAVGLIFISDNTFSKMFLSRVVRRAFPRTVRRYERGQGTLGTIFGESLVVAYAREVGWGIVGLLPATVWFFLRSS